MSWLLPSPQDGSVVNTGWLRAELSQLPALTLLIAHLFGKDVCALVSVIAFTAGVAVVAGGLVS